MRQLHYPEIFLLDKVEPGRNHPFKVIWEGTVSTNCPTEGFGFFLPFAEESSGWLDGERFPLDVLTTECKGEQAFKIEAAFSKEVCAGCLYIRPETGGENWVRAVIHSVEIRPL